jgi:hypothetical protein
MRTLQEMFNLAYKGLESQNWQKSQNSDGSCAYTIESELKCTIGHTIPDIAQYQSAEWFSKGVIEVPPEILDTEASTLDLVWLQRAHDWSKSPENCKARLEAFAERRRLTIPNS